LKDIPIIPSEYKSNIFRELPNHGNSTFKTDILRQEKWTADEEEWCYSLHKQGFTYNEIAISVSRGVHSVSLKIKRLKKKKDEYNCKHRDLNMNQTTNTWRA
jgi:hypothetical protein